MSDVARRSPRPIRSVLLTAAFWLVPPLFCLALYWYGLKAWFQRDDFAWLGLDMQVHNAAEFWQTLFTPMAQGTIRPLSERIYFMGLHRLFGLDALPWRILAFLTQFANLALLSSIVWRLTRSRAAAFLAPFLWIVNSAMVIAMSWSSAYNQLLCGLFLLSAFALFLRYEATGRNRDYWIQFLVFAAGFGALEINVVYPALVFTYILLRHGWILGRLLATAPLFTLSAIFTVVHLHFAPPQTTGAYGLHFDGSMLRTLLTFWQWSLVPPVGARWLWDATWLSGAATALLTLALLAFVVRRALQRQYLPLIFLAWFVVLLAPVLPLRDHVADYYLTLPLIGLASLGALALAESWRRRLPWKAASASCLAIYLSLMLPAARSGTRWHYERARAVRTLVLGVERVHELHPGKAILLANIDDELYGTAIADSPFRLLGLRDVYLTPESGAQIHPNGNLAPVGDYVLAPGPTLHALKTDGVVVYERSGDRLRNITSSYEIAALSRLTEAPPRRVDVGNPLLSYLLGPTWYPIEAGFRWMPGEASVRIGAPQRQEDRLQLTGACPAELLQKGPLALRILVDGTPAGIAEISEPESPFRRLIALPPSSVGKHSIEVAVHLSRTYQPDPEARPLGLVFGTFEIQ